MSGAYRYPLNVNTLGQSQIPVNPVLQAHPLRKLRFCSKLEIEKPMRSGLVVMRTGIINPGCWRWMNFFGAAPERTYFSTETESLTGFPFRKSSSSVQLTSWKQTEGTLVIPYLISSDTPPHATATTWLNSPNYIYPTTVDVPVIDRSLHSTQYPFTGRYIVPNIHWLVATLEYPIPIDWSLQSTQYPSTVLNYFQLSFHPAPPSRGGPPPCLHSLFY